MLNRTVPLAVCLYAMSAAALAAGNQGTGYIFEFASTATASGQFQGFVYNANSLGTPVFSNTGPVGATQVVAKPDGSQFYIPGSGGLVSFDPAFQTPTTINGITGTPTTAVITPDGRYLLLAATTGTGASSVYVLNTSSNTVVLNQAISGSVVGMVPSRDSNTVWILGESSATFIVTLNLTKLQQVGSPVYLRDPNTGNNLGGGATSMGLSPLGLLYVTAVNQILEINPTTITNCATNQTTCVPVATAGEIGVNATPGPIQFSSDGTQAYFVNQTPNIGGQALLRMTISGHNVISWPPFVAGQQVVPFDSVVVASPTRLFGHSTDGTLWDVAPDFSTVAVSTLQSVAPATNVLAIALSGELPNARYLFTLVGGGTLASIYRIDLSNNTLTSQASAALGQGNLQFAYVPQEANPATFLQYNQQQTLSAGASSQPLIARVLDAVGLPVYTVPVTFSGDPSLTFSNATAITNADGYVQTVVTVGQAPGQYPVTLTAGSGNTAATATFTLTIPGGVVGPGGGPNLMTMISGNGQLFDAGFQNYNNPLTVQLMDTKGNVIQNAAVVFAVTGAPIGSLDNPNATTDQNGMAYTDFLPQVLSNGTSYEGTTVTATYSDTSGNTLGSATFTETIYTTNSDGTGAPTVRILQPVSNPAVITAGEGDVIPEAIVASVFSGSYGAAQPIPGVGIRIADADNPQNLGPAQCQGYPANPLTGQDGSVHCNLIATCATAMTGSGQPLGLGLHGFIVVVGEYAQNTGWAVNIVPGSTRTLTMNANNSGNNQSGKPGAVLSIPLSAQVTDNCGTAAQGAAVTWKVTQGLATLKSASTVSNQGGTVTNTVTLGQTPGTVTITATLGTTVLTYTETISAVVGALKLVSGGNQTANENKAFTNPLVFQITDNNNNPVPSLTVNFSIAGGSASLGASSGTTNAQGEVSVGVTAGNLPGTVTVTATYAGFTATATLTVSAPGLPLTPTSFVNAASLQSGLAPCSLSSVTGAGLAPTLNGVVLGNPLGIGPLPYTLNGVTITVNGTPAPLQSISNQNGVQQVNFQTPCETVPGSATVVVQVNSTSTTVAGVNVYAAQPGIFTYAGPSGIAYGWVINATDGSYLSPSNLAHAGNTYYLVATGLGQTTPAATTNAAGTGTQTIPVGNVILAVDNVGVSVTSVEYLQGQIGLYLITFTIPAVTNGQPFPTGTNLPITLEMIVNGQTFADNAPVALPGIK